MRNRNRRRDGSSRNNRRKSSKLFTLLIVLIMIAGVGIMIYPSFSNWYNQRHQSRVIADYNQLVSSNDDATNQALWDAAVAYNEELAVTGTNFYLGMYSGDDLFTLDDDSVPDSADSNALDPDSAGADAAGTDSASAEETGSFEAELEAAREIYEATLDVSGTGIMGYIDIDKINVHLPIYHDSSESVLQVAVGHIAGTSLPVGGSSSHCVLTGHTGLPSAKLFTDIDQLEEGDTFQLVVLNHVLTYQVSDIQVVLPNEVSSLKIQDGEDLCTLVTCTPYGINTHRLLVTGKRIETPVDYSGYETLNLLGGSGSGSGEDSGLPDLLPFILIAAAAAGVIIVVFVTAAGKRRRYRVRRKDGFSVEDHVTGNRAAGTHVTRNRLAGDRASHDTGKRLTGYYTETDSYQREGTYPEDEDYQGEETYPEDEDDREEENYQDYDDIIDIDAEMDDDGSYYGGDEDRGYRNDFINDDWDD